MNTIRSTPQPIIENPNCSGPTVAIYNNNGLRSIVGNFHKGGFSVVLWDVSKLANGGVAKALPMASVFSTLNGALDYAKSIVGLETLIPVLI